MIVKRQIDGWDLWRDLLEVASNRWLPERNQCTQCFGCRKKEEKDVSAINTWRHADPDLIMLVRCLYFCLNFKSYFIVLWEEQKALVLWLVIVLKRKDYLSFSFHWCYNPGGDWKDIPNHCHCSKGLLILLLLSNRLRFCSALTILPKTAYSSLQKQFCKKILRLPFALNF